MKDLFAFTYAIVIACLSYFLKGFVLMKIYYWTLYEKVNYNIDYSFFIGIVLVFNFFTWNFKKEKVGSKELIEKTIVAFLFPLGFLLITWIIKSLI